MSEERNPREQETLVDVAAMIIAAYQMVVGDYVVRATCNKVTKHYHITLPDVARAAGKFYSILARDADGTNFIQVQDQDESECWQGDYVLNAPCESILLYSDGLKWWDCSKAITGKATTGQPK